MRQMQIYLGWEAFWATGEKLFGKKMSEWKFQCPQCGDIKVVGKKQGSRTKPRVVMTADTCLECRIFLQQITVNPDSYPSELVELYPQAFDQTKALPSLKLPHSARVLWKNGPTEYDKPLFDFYRPAETGERTRATGDKNADELRAGNS